MKICIIDTNKREHFIDVSKPSIEDGPAFIAVGKCYTSDSDGNKTQIYIKRMREHTAQSLCNYIFANYKQD